jgi:hypothetical protein
MNHRIVSIDSRPIVSFQYDHSHHFQWIQWSRSCVSILEFSNTVSGIRDGGYGEIFGLDELFLNSSKDVSLKFLSHFISYEDYAVVIPSIFLSKTKHIENSVSALQISSSNRALVNLKVQIHSSCK